MSLVKEKDLVIGDEYWIDMVGRNKGIFVGNFEDSAFFYPTSNSDYSEDDDGTIGFYSFPEDEYEEV